MPVIHTSFSAQQTSPRTVCYRRSVVYRHSLDVATPHLFAAVLLQFSEFYLIWSKINTEQAGMICDLL